MCPQTTTVYSLALLFFVNKLTCGIITFGTRRENVLYFSKKNLVHLYVRVCKQPLCMLPLDREQPHPHSHLNRQYSILTPPASISTLLRNAVIIQPPQHIHFQPPQHQPTVTLHCKHIPCVVTSRTRLARRFFLEITYTLNIRMYQLLFA